MIEIKVNSIEVDNKKAKIHVEGCAEHLGTYGEFVDEMVAVFESLEKIDREVFKDALHDFLDERIINDLRNLCDSEDESEDEE